MLLVNPEISQSAFYGLHRLSRGVDGAVSAIISTALLVCVVFGMLTWLLWNGLLSGGKLLLLWGDLTVLRTRNAVSTVLLRLHRGGSLRNHKRTTVNIDDLIDNEKKKKRAEGDQKEGNGKSTRVLCALGQHEVYSFSSVIVFIRKSWVSTKGRKPD